MNPNILSPCPYSYGEVVDGFLNFGRETSLGEGNLWTQNC